MGITPSIEKPKVLASMQTCTSSFLFFLSFYCSIVLIFLFVFVLIIILGPLEKIQGIIRKFLDEEYQFGLHPCKLFYFPSFPFLFHSFLLIIISFLYLLNSS